MRYCCRRGSNNYVSVKNKDLVRDTVWLGWLLNNKEGNYVFRQLVYKQFAFL